MRLDNKTWTNPVQQRGRSQRLEDYLEGGAALAVHSSRSPRALVEQLGALPPMSDQQHALLERHFRGLPWAAWTPSTRARYIEALLEQPMDRQLRQTLGFTTSLGKPAEGWPTAAAGAIADSLSAPEVTASLLDSAKRHGNRAAQLVGAKKHLESAQAQAIAVVLRRQAGKDGYARAVRDLIRRAAVAPGGEVLLIRYCYKALKHPESYKLRNAAGYGRVKEDACHAIYSLCRRWGGEIDADMQRFAITTTRLVEQTAFVWNRMFEDFEPENATPHLKYIGSRAQQSLKVLQEKVGAYSRALDMSRLQAPFSYYGKADLVRGYLKPHERIESELVDYGDLTEAVQAFVNNATSATSATTKVRNLIFVGPPGAGKTERALALAKHTSLPILVLRQSDFICKYMGESSRKVADIYAGAQALADEMGRKVIVYIDEIDALVRHRSADGGSGAVGQENDRVAVELMNVLDTGSKNPYDRVLTIGSSNHVKAIDRALLDRVQVDTVDFPNEFLRGKLISKTRPPVAPLGEGAEQRVAREAMDCEAAVNMTSGLNARDIVDLISKANGHGDEWLRYLRRAIMKDAALNQQVKIITRQDSVNRFTHHLVKIDQFKELHTRVAKRQGKEKEIDVRLGVHKDDKLVVVVKSLTLTFNTLWCNKSSDEERRSVSLSILNSAMDTVAGGLDVVWLTAPLQAGLVQPDGRAYVEVTIIENCED